MNAAGRDTQFSKARLEMLCNGIFAIAMTLLVLELKVPFLLIGLVARRAATRITPTAAAPAPAVVSHEPA